jgi:hypothetical protein
MTTMISEIYDALIDAGATEEKARRAASVLADYDSQLAAIDAKLSVALWAGGLLFAAVLGSQALLWTGMGRVDGSLAQISGQLAHIEQTVAR